jgi:rhodanese-related sulfurtransferase
MFGLFGKKTPSLSMKDAQAELAKDRSIVLLDVRTKDEHKNGHIKGSVNVPLDRLPVSITQKVPNKQASFSSTASVAAVPARPAAG